MIIQIRGTSGTGKSYIARQILALYDTEVIIRSTDIPIWPDGEKHPKKSVASIFTDSTGKYKQLGVVGRYDTPCGGADVLSTYPQLMCVIAHLRQQVETVFFEGLMISTDVHKLHACLGEDINKLRVIKLDTPISECAKSITERRLAKGDTRPVDPTHARKKMGTITSTCARLARIGATSSELNRIDCFNHIKELLCVN